MAINYDITQGLFGDIMGLQTTPEEQRSKYLQGRNAQAVNLAQLDAGRTAVAAGGMLAQDLGQNVEGLGGGIRRNFLGIETQAEQEKQITEKLQKEAAQIANTQGLEAAVSYIQKGYSEAGLNQKALKAAQLLEQVKQRNLFTKAELETKQAQARKATAEAGKYELSIQQEEKLRAELQQLGPNATEDQIIAVVTKYGSPDKILELLQKKELAKQSRAEKAAERAKKASMLPASLQKEEDKDLTSIDSYEAQAEALAPSIQNLTPNQAGVRKLQLGPVQNSKYMAQNLAGNSTEESRAFEALKSAVDTAVNLQVSAEKGVQTDKDVLRFAKALIGAFGRNDTQATLEALQRYKEAIDKAKERTKVRLESRRKSQNVEPYYGNIAPPSLATTPIAPEQKPAPQGQGAVVRFGRDANGNIVPLGGK